MKYMPPLDGDLGDLNRPYIDANPAYGIQGSIPPANAIEHPMREIEHVIKESGLTPTEDDLTQLYKAIEIIVDEKIPEMPEIPQAFPAGTIMLFAQTAAPSGWTKITNAGYNQRALRLVTGNASSGGNLDFTSAFSSKSFSMSMNGNVGNSTLSEGQMPSHDHTVSVGNDNGSWPYANGCNSSNGHSSIGGYAGSSQPHTHPFSDATGSGSIDLRVKYIDVILARKD